LIGEVLPWVGMDGGSGVASRNVLLSCDDLNFGFGRVRGGEGGEVGMKILDTWLRLDILLLNEKLLKLEHKRPSPCAWEIGEHLSVFG